MPLACIITHSRGFSHLQFYLFGDFLNLNLVFFSSGETDDDFDQTVELIKEYKLAQVHISQFYPRPGMLLPVLDL